MTDAERRSEEQKRRDLEKRARGDIGLRVSDRYGGLQKLSVAWTQ